jgi:hypothetical protein
MPEPIIRKLSTSVEEIYHEGGPIADIPLKRVAAIAVIKNPFAGRYEPNIQGFIDDLRPLGLMMARKMVEIIGDASLVEGYGKGALIGSAREVIGGSKAIVPSSKKVGAAGARLDVPVTHINASYVRSHFDSMEIGLNDSPRADEMLLALVMTTGARVHSRSGGLEADDITGEDGLR